jgi:Phage integrase family
MRTSPEAYATRADAARALWELVEDGRADYNQDLRFRALVLLATFASLRWGEAIALRRCDVDLRACAVRVRATLAERSNGQILLGPPKSKAGMRVVGFPKVIRPVLQGHLSLFAGPEPGALVFPGAKGGPLRRGNFNKLSGWHYAPRVIGAEGLHFHDLRHTGNAFAAASGAGLRDLMARMGHDSERAAIIYQHAARDADQAIAEAKDAQVRGSAGRQREGDDGSSGVPVPAGTCTLIARTGLRRAGERKAPTRLSAVSCGFVMERVTGIEPALSAWEVCGAARVLPAESVTCGDLDGLSASDRDYPWALLPSGTQRARVRPRIKRRARRV